MLLSNSLINLLLLLLLLLKEQQITKAQHREGDPQYEQSYEYSSQQLKYKIGQHHSRHKNKPQYKLSQPDPEDYIITLLANPCGSNTTTASGSFRALGYDCCMDHFGRGEYGIWNTKMVERMQPYPAFRKGRSDGPVEGTIDDASHNLMFVDEEGNSIPDAELRMPRHDRIVLDEECIGMRDPHPNCIFNRARAERVKTLVPCSDNNQTIDALAECYVPSSSSSSDGYFKSQHCMQIGYGQNSYIFTCANDENNIDNDHCGTFIEIHRSSPYDSEYTVLSDVKINVHKTNGIRTTTIPLTYKGDKRKILCNYQETHIRVGSMVLVNENAPKCCCPRSYSYQTKIGSFFCPKRFDIKDGGPFAPRHDDEILAQIDFDDFQREYPTCFPSDFASDGRSEEDMLLCSRLTAGELPLTTTKFYTDTCTPLMFNETLQSYSSNDLVGEYKQQCLHSGRAFQACGGAHHSDSNISSSCHSDDSLNTFQGMIGKVTSIPDEKNNNHYYGVTFNDGRTSYLFHSQSIELVPPKSNYELWFVQRLASSNTRIIQKRKGIRVHHPQCTFDTVNDRYFPFALLNDEGGIIERAAEYDGQIMDHGFPAFTI